MKLVINGDVKQCFGSRQEGGLMELFEELGILPEGRFVELNGTIFKETDFASIRVKDNDVIEIIQFMGGGYYSPTHSNFNMLKFNLSQWGKIR